MHVTDNSVPLKSGCKKKSGWQHTPKMSVGVSHGRFLELRFTRMTGRETPKIQMACGKGGPQLHMNSQVDAKVQL